jgi:hypothetical protein
LHLPSPHGRSHADLTFLLHLLHRLHHRLTRRSSRPGHLARAVHATLATHHSGLARRIVCAVGKACLVKTALDDA